MATLGTQDVPSDKAVETGPQVLAASLQTAVPTTLKQAVKKPCHRNPKPTQGRPILL